MVTIDFFNQRLFVFCICIGYSLPVPLNLFPSPTFIVNTFHWLKRMIFRMKSSSEEEKKNIKEIIQESPLHINLGRIVNTVNNPNMKSGVLKNRKVSMRERSSIVFSEKLTYKIVIERMVKRFLLYYKNSHHGLDQTKEGLEFREIKNDISSFRLEVSYQIDQLDETSTSLIESMNKFHENLKDHFDFEQIKQHLDHQTI
jgi:hypothetical protein